MPLDNGVLCAASFVAGLIVGVVGYWAARKIYWRIKTPRYVRHHLSRLRYRHRFILASRHRRYYPARHLRSYSGYNSDYRLSKLFEKLDRQDND